MFYFFDRFRQLGNDPYDTSLIRFYTPTPHSTNMYCMGNYNGIDATALIDGKNETAYANNEYVPEQQYAIIEFVKAPIYINRFYFHTLCNPPKDVTLEGSNDNQNWETIQVYNSPLPPYNVTTIPCNKLKLFKFIKISQSITADDQYYRIHIHHIEIFGSVGALPTISKDGSTVSVFLLSFLFMLYNK